MPSNRYYSSLSEIDRLCVNTIRFLSVDAVQQANSGHPGLPMGMAGIVYRLFTKVLQFNPRNPKWHNRDRFVLSAGHGSALLYSALHLFGYEVSLDDLRNFRQMGAKTPGHPEYGHTPGVEATTGPLGQGISNAVGMAIAEKYLAAHFNQPDHTIIDYNVYALAGDGCLQEGVSSEACSLAGHLGLDNLIVIYDDNQVTIDGGTDISFTEDVPKRFEAYGWQVIEVDGDGHNFDAFDAAIQSARNQSTRPTLIKTRSIIGFGSPNKQGTSGVHGSPLGKDEIEITRKELGWPHDSFYIPDAVRDECAKIVEKGVAKEDQWNQMMVAYQQAFPALKDQFESASSATWSGDWEKKIPLFEADASVATRVASGKFLEAVMPDLPLILGGSADLTPSNNTKFSTATAFQRDDYSGRYIHFGVREHAMGAILNGISLSGLLKAYGATFLCFADYMLPSIRVAALSGYSSIYVFTHDSIGLGEDGPTHQPVEHISYLRAMPGLVSFRPADANETVAAWRYAITQNKGPVAMALTRQGLPTLDQTKYGSADQVTKGGYVVISDDQPDAVIIATGSELHLALEARETLLKEGVKTRIVSMPSCELFDEQSTDYQQRVIPPMVKCRVVVEAGIQRGWEKYMGDSGVFIGMPGFGASAPASDLFNHFGITTQAVVDAVMNNR